MLSDLHGRAHAVDEREERERSGVHHRDSVILVGPPIFPVGHTADELDTLVLVPAVGLSNALHLQIRWHDNSLPIRLRVGHATRNLMYSRRGSSALSGGRERRALNLPRYRALGRHGGGMVPSLFHSSGGQLRGSNSDGTDSNAQPTSHRVAQISERLAPENGAGRSAHQIANLLASLGQGYFILLASFRSIDLASECVKLTISHRRHKK